MRYVHFIKLTQLQENTMQELSIHETQLVIEAVESALRKGLTDNGDEMALLSALHKFKGV